ncbi:MAG: Mediator of RNA polymerase II transcription subunit 6 [Pycnora praestabilis]|nr:MAG: Mediator of RNA polymerase II transcription subunit 6 [Pycnora praestabilis]
MFHLIQTREAFEGRLKTMQGVEFIVASEPSQVAQQNPGSAGAENTGVWVIRKQNRRKRQGNEDELTVQSSYFVVGENVYMAPSVGNVLGSRMLSTVTSLTKFLSIASSLPTFSPSSGYKYLNEAPKALTAFASSQPSQLSKENTPMLDSQGQARSTKDPLTSTTISAADQLELLALERSFGLSLRYGNDYMDENPLVGEPGAFHFKSTHGHAQAPSQSQSKPPPVVKTSSPPTPQPKPSPSPTNGRKGSKFIDKSPTTPGGLPKPKRRKSKAVGTVGNPTGSN